MLFAYGPLLTNYEISRLWNDLVCVEWDVIANLHTHLLTLTNSHTRYGVAKSCSAVIRLSVCAGLRSDCTVATAIHLRWFKQASHWHDMACNLACQWQKNSLNYAWGCVAMRDRWSSACHVVAEIFKNVQKIIFKVLRLVTTKLLSARAWRWVSRISWTVRNLCSD